MGKLLEVTTKIEEVNSMLVEEKKKSSNLKRKNKVKNLVEKQRPNVQVDLKEHSDGAGDNSSEAQLMENSKEPKEIDTGLAIHAFPTGRVLKRKLTLRDVSQLSIGYKIVVLWNKLTRQPIGKGGKLYNRFLAEQGGNFKQFDISAETWKKVQPSAKNWVWDNTVKSKFAVWDAHKDYSLSKIGKGWKNRRNRLYHLKNRDGTRSTKELEADVPDLIQPEDWAKFVRYRRSLEHRAVSRRTMQSRAHRIIHHTAGSKPFSRTYTEMDKAVQRESRRVTYGDMYVASHRHNDRTPLSNEIEEIIPIQRTDVELRESQGSTIDPTTSPKAPLEGRDQHPGRLSGFEFRTTGTVVFKESKYKAGTSSSTAASQVIISGPRRHSDIDVDRDLLSAKIKEEVQANLAQTNLAQVQAQMLEEMQAKMQAQLEMWRQAANSMLQMAFQMAQLGSAPPQLPPVPNFFMAPPAQPNLKPRQPIRSEDPPKDQDDPLARTT